MSYLVLARKYRPQTFEDVVGQPHVTQTLSNAISANRVAHALLFTGPRGTGKTTLARIVAKSLNCEKGPSATPCNQCMSCETITAGNSVDVIEIDGASNNGVEKVRDLRENIRYLPTHGRYRIYIIDEVHMLTTGAFNALLKILEEPPAHALFLFATTDPNKIPITILSRCQRHDLKRIETTLLHDHLKSICAAEKVDLPESSLWMIARQADGSVRDALSLLDLVFASGENKTLEFVTDLLGGVEQKILLDFSENVFAGNLPAILAQIEEAHIRGIDFLKLYKDIMEHFRNLVVLKTDGNAGQLIDLPEAEIELLKKQIESVSPLYLGQLTDFLFDQETFMRFASQPRMALEMVFIRLMQFKPQVSVDMLIEQLEILRQEIKDTGGMPVKKKERITTPAIPAEKTSSKSQVLGLNNEEEETPAEISDSPVAAKKEDGSFDWDRYMLCLSDDNPMLAGFLSQANATAGAFQENELKLIIGGTEFGFKQIQKRKKELEKHITQFLDRPVGVTLISQVITADEKKEKRQQEDALRREILNHPIVKEATRLFKGELTGVTVLEEEDA